MVTPAISQCPTTAFDSRPLTPCPSLDHSPNLKHCFRLPLSTSSFPTAVAKTKIDANGDGIINMEEASAFVLSIMPDGLEDKQNLAMREAKRMGCEKGASIDDFLAQTKESFCDKGGWPEMGKKLECMEGTRTGLDGYA